MLDYDNLTSLKRSSIFLPTQVVAKMVESNKKDVA